MARFQIRLTPHTLRCIHPERAALPRLSNARLLPP
jgi:hypothetical protein